MLFKLNLREIVWRRELFHCCLWFLKICFQSNIFSFHFTSDLYTCSVIPRKVYTCTWNNFKNENCNTLVDTCTSFLIYFDRYERNSKIFSTKRYTIYLLCNYQLNTCNWKGTKVIWIWLVKYQNNIIYTHSFIWHKHDTNACFVYQSGCKFIIMPLCGPDRIIFLFIINCSQ